MMTFVKACQGRYQCYYYLSYNPFHILYFRFYHVSLGHVKVMCTWPHKFQCRFYNIPQSIIMLCTYKILKLTYTKRCNSKIAAKILINFCLLNVDNSSSIMKYQSHNNQCTIYFNVCMYVLYFCGLHIWRVIQA